MSLPAQQRHEMILEEVRRRGYASSVAMAAACGVSDMTIRRDMQMLTEAGLAKRVPGGLAPNSSGHVLDTALPFGLRNDRAREIKTQLCRKAAEVLQQDRGLTLVGVDAGTTVASVAGVLPPGTTVVTHSLPMLQSATARDDIGVIGLGGSWLPETRAFCGVETRRQLEELTLDCAILSCAAISERGLYSAHEPDVDVKQAMIRAADRVMCLADASKFSERALMRFAELDQVDDFIISGEPPAWLHEVPGARIHRIDQ